jgi:hypothetical protein
MNVSLDDEWVEWMARDHIDNMDTSSVRILVPDVQGQVNGFIVKREDTTIQWTRRPDATDVCVARVWRAFPGAIVARTRYIDADVLLCGFGQVHRNLVGCLLRLCVEEDAQLSRHYVARGPHDDVLIHRADGLCFITHTMFLVHCLDTTNVDVLDELRHRPHARFPTSADFIIRAHSVNRLSTI